MTESGGAVARVYATALFELADKDNALDERLEEVRVLQTVFEREDKLRAVLESPKVQSSDKESLMSDVMGNEVSPHLKSLVLLLIRRNRHFFLRSILAAFAELYEESKGRIRASVTTAKPLSEEEASRLIDGLSERIGREVLLDREVDSDLLGGAVMRWGDYIVDGSLRSRIRRMRETLLESSDR